MKVDSAQLVSLFADIKSLLCGIEETFQYGENVEETITDIADDIKKAINIFSIEHMSPPKIEVLKTVPSFLKKYDALCKKLDERDGLGMTVSENVDLFKAQFYLFLKRRLNEIEIPINLNRWQLVTHIEDKIVVGSKFDYSLRTDFDRDAYNVMEIVADAILDHRRKHPQFEISFETEKKSPSKNLIDFL